MLDVEMLPTSRSSNTPKYSQEQEPHQQISITSSSNSSATTTSKTSSTLVEGTSDNLRFQIFLGGSCNPTTWRQNVAIPFLETNGITFYNPQTEDWSPELVTVERRAKQTAKLLLFVIDKQTRSTVSLIESAYMAGDNRDLVLVINPFDYSIVSISDKSTQVSSIVETRTTTTSSRIRNNLLASSKSKTAESFVESSSTCSSSSSSMVTSNLSTPSYDTRNAQYPSQTCTHTSPSLTSSKVTTLSAARVTTQTSPDTCKFDQKTMESVHEEANEFSGALKINGELISLPEFNELKRARYILQRLVRGQQIPIFNDINQALEHVSKNLSLLQQTHINQDSDVKNDLIISNEVSKLGLMDEDVVSRSPLENPTTTNGPVRDIYLSLDSDDKTCLESAVIPMLEENGLSYTCSDVNSIVDCDSLPFNEQPVQLESNLTQSIESAQNRLGAIYKSTTVSESGGIGPLMDRVLDKEICAIQSSRVLLFVITNKCRGLSIMVLASHFMALFRDNVVLCIQYLNEPCSINGEPLTKTAIADYNRGRVYLCDYAIKSQVPVFSTIQEAIECCSRKCRYDNNKPK